MKPTRHWLLRTTLLLLVAISTAGCFISVRKLTNLFNRTNDYAEAHQTLDAEAQAYYAELSSVTTQDPNDAGTRIRKAGAVTDPQWREIDAIVTNVQQISALVEQDMRTWGLTGVRPISYDTNHRALKTAQDKLMNITRRVRP